MFPLQVLHTPVLFTIWGILWAELVDLSFRMDLIPFFFCGGLKGHRRLKLVYKFIQKCVSVIWRILWSSSILNSHRGKWIDDLVIFARVSSARADSKEMTWWFLSWRKIRWQAVVEKPCAHAHICSHPLFISFYRGKPRSLAFLFMFPLHVFFLLAFLFYFFLKFHSNNLQFAQLTWCFVIACVPH